MVTNETNEVIRRPLIVGVGGFSSNVGKTTLLCNLLREFPGWEAIKSTRGHYRSCGKDPHACCVSHLLEEKAVVRSGRELTYVPGKDTGLYWEAGAENVHWVIATDAQVNDGVQQALSRVRSESVFIEGNSFTQTVVPDFFIMVMRPDNLSIKRTARSALSLAAAVYISDNGRQPSNAVASNDLLEDLGFKAPVFSPKTLSALVKKIRETVERSRQTHLRSAAS